MFVVQLAKDRDANGKDFLTFFWRHFLMAMKKIHKGMRKGNAITLVIGTHLQILVESQIEVVWKGRNKTYLMKEAKNKEEVDDAKDNEGTKEDNDGIED